MRKDKLKEIALGILGFILFIALAVGYVFFFGREKIYVGFAHSEPGLYEARLPCEPERSESQGWVTVGCTHASGEYFAITSAPVSEAGRASDDPVSDPGSTLELIEKKHTKLNDYDAVRFVTKFENTGGSGYARFYKLEKNGRVITISINADTLEGLNNEYYSELLNSFKLL